MTVTRRSLFAALAALLLLAGPIACGKRGALEVPEGREAEFTYPKAYPAPQGVLPGAEAEAAEEPAAADDFGLRPRDSKVSTFPRSGTETKVFGPVTSQ